MKQPIRIVVGLALGLGLVAACLAEARPFRKALSAAPPARRMSDREASELPQAEVIKLFKEKVEPVLRDHCYECHSAEARELKAELRLDTREGLLRGAANGPAVVPGDVESSFLLRSMRYSEDDYKMPPRGKLDDEVLSDIETWIKNGAHDGR